MADDLNNCALGHQADRVATEIGGVRKVKVALATRRGSQGSNDAAPLLLDEWIYWQGVHPLAYDLGRL
jgi:hypothetical protein